MSITAAIEKATLAELLPMVSDAVTTLSFLGWRSIQIFGYEGKAPIDLLAKRVIELASKQNFEFTQQDRVLGISISEQISRVYKNIDQQVSQSNFFTRLCCAIRDVYAQFSPSIHPLRFTSLTRWIWEGGHDGANGIMPRATPFSELFFYYTLPQYLETFGEEPTYKVHFAGYNRLVRVLMAKPEKLQNIKEMRLESQRPMAKPEKLQNIKEMRLESQKPIFSKEVELGLPAIVEWD